MTIVVQAPNGATIQFPDGTPEAEITRIMAGNFPSETGTVEDVTKSGASGVVRGAAQMLGLPKDLTNIANTAIDRAPVSDRMKEALGVTLRTIFPIASLSTDSKNLKKTFEENVTPLHNAETTAGEYANTIGEFIPGMVMGPVGGSARAIASNFGKFVLGPALVSETAGQATKGTQLEPYARAAGAIGAAGTAAALSRPRGANAVLSESLQGRSPQEIQAAQALMEEAGTRGINLTFAQALDQVTNGGAKGLLNVERVVENSQRGRQTMSDFYAGQPQAQRAAVLQEADNIAAPTNQPSMVGPQAAEAAENSLESVRRAINAAAEPYYNAAAPQRLSPQEFQRMQALPGWQEAIDTIRNNPQLNRYVANLPDDSVGVLNEVKKYFDNASRNVASVTNPQRNVQASAGFTQDANAARETAIRADGGQQGAYAQALETERVGRETMLRPLQEGTLGKVANARTTEDAVNAVLPWKPLAGSQDEVRIAVSQIAQQNEPAARDLVRQYIENTLNATTRAKAGPSDFGGAKFRAAIFGNQQNAQNVQAAIEALPNGQQIWAGFDRLGTILEATGRRQNLGSQTQPNLVLQQRLESGGTLPDLAATIASPGKWVTRARDVYQSWRYGQNTGELARILTDPNSAPLLIELAGHPAGSQRAWEIAGRLFTPTVVTAPRPQLAPAQ